MAATMTRANAKEITPRSAIPRIPLFRMRVAGAEPTPMNTRKAVLINSAASFWTCVGSSSMEFPLEYSEGPDGDVGGCAQQRGDLVVELRSCDRASGHGER